MAARRVTQSRKDSDGDITALGNPTEWWSPRPKDDVISDIEGGAHSYYVESYGTQTDIHVVQGSSGKYLRTDPDKTATNNLSDLPDC